MYKVPLCILFFFFMGGGVGGWGVKTADLLYFMNAKLRDGQRSLLCTSNK